MIGSIGTGADLESSTPPINPFRTTSMATFATVVAIMPAFLVGASGTFVRKDLGFDEAGLGIVIAVFFAFNATFSTVGGRFAERIGAQRALVFGCVGSALVMLAVSFLVTNLIQLASVLAWGGWFNAVTQPGTNLALSQVLVTRIGFMFGVKQAAIPLATMLAGASVPVVSLTVGWRWAFVGGAALSVAAAAFVPRQLESGTGKTPGTGKTRKRVREGDAATAPLVALAVAAGVGTAAAVSLGSFLVETAIAGGIEVGSAGWLLVAGSFAGVVARLTAGLLADRRRGVALYAISTMLVVGAGGYGMLALGGPTLLTVGAVLGYGGGWGWGGLLNFAIVRFNPNAPAVASGIVLAGAAGGATVGPFAFGYVVTSASFQIAWSLAAAAAFLSAGLVLVARNWLFQDLVRQPGAIRGM